MSNTQDTNSKGQAEPSESLKDAVQNKISSTPAKDALGRRWLCRQAISA
ncbi:hypothetical protein [Bradyrhizobium sp. WSM1743]|nr:hypothetical protein [Bradyrhizobium sp. WSM1743]